MSKHIISLVIVISLVVSTSSQAAGMVATQVRSECRGVDKTNVLLMRQCIEQDMANADTYADEVGAWKSVDFWETIGQATASTIAVTTALYVTEADKKTAETTIIFTAVVGFVSGGIMYIFKLVRAKRTLMEKVMERKGQVGGYQAEFSWNARDGKAKLVYFEGREERGGTIYIKPNK